MDYRNLLQLASDNSSFAKKKADRLKNRLSNGDGPHVSADAVRSYLAKSKLKQETRRADEEAARKKRIQERLESVQRLKKARDSVNQKELFEELAKKKLVEQQNVKFKIGKDHLRKPGDVEAVCKKRKEPSSHGQSHSKLSEPSVNGDCFVQDAKSKVKLKGKDEEHTARIPSKVPSSERNQSAVAPALLKRTKAVDGEVGKAGLSFRDLVSAARQNAEKASNPDYVPPKPAPPKKPEVPTDVPFDPDRDVRIRKRKVDKKSSRPEANVRHVDKISHVEKANLPNERNLKRKPAVVATPKGVNSTPDRNVTSKGSKIRKVVADIKSAPKSVASSEKQAAPSAQRKQGLIAETVSSKTVQLPYKQTKPRSSEPERGSLKPLGIEAQYGVARARASETKSGLVRASQAIQNDRKVEKSSIVKRSSDRTVDDLEAEFEREERALERKRRLFEMKRVTGADGSYGDEEEPEADDDDMDDFIDDSADTPDVSKYIKQIFGYDRNMYDDSDDDDDLASMEVGYSQIQKEEERSERIARREDAIEQYREEQEMKRRQERAKALMKAKKR